MKTEHGAINVELFVGHAAILELLLKTSNEIRAVTGAPPGPLHCAHTGLTSPEAVGRLDQIPGANGSNTSSRQTER